MPMVEHLDGDRPIQPEVARQPDRRHAAAPELALERVVIGEGGGEKVAHGTGEK